MEDIKGIGAVKHFFGVKKFLPNMWTTLEIYTALIPTKVYHQS
ncbi:MAG: hypothetical protein ACM3QR_00440 [Syntrophothermus sp.]